MKAFQKEMLLESKYHFPSSLFNSLPKPKPCFVFLGIQEIVCRFSDGAEHTEMITGEKMDALPKRSQSFDG